MGDFGDSRDKWVCPNDRELCLRAKLKKGWSVKKISSNTFGGRTPGLNDAEQESILSVIRRAEGLDRVEQERVGRLVERLDNMKKNAMGNGSTQCVLCADEFGILTASPLHCNDCNKAVCTKCGVDTFSANKEPLWLCKICAETRETWKKSGAWFYKGLPKYVLPGRKQDQGRYSARSADTSKSYASWLQSKAGRGGSDRECTDSSDDEFKSSRLSKRVTVVKKPDSGAGDLNDSTNVGPDCPTFANSSPYARDLSSSSLDANRSPAREGPSERREPSPGHRYTRQPDRGQRDTRRTQQLKGSLSPVPSGAAAHNNETFEDCAAPPPREESSKQMKKKKRTR